MNRLGCVCALLAAFVLGDAWAEEPGVTIVSTGVGHERVSSNAPDWRSSYIQLNHFLTAKRSFGIRVAEHHRFGLRDSVVELSLYTPLPGDVSLFAEVTASPQHQFLAKQSAQVQLSLPLGGFVVGGGVKSADYNMSRVTTGDVTLERYFGDYRFALSANPSWSSVAGNAASYRAVLSSYYGRSNVQVLLAGGTELEQVSAVLPIVSTRTSSAAVYGRHWFSEAWGADYSIGQTSRDGVGQFQIGLGAVYRFW